MADTELNPKQKLIIAVQKMGRQFDAVAQSVAVEFARDPDDEKKKQDARRWVDKADECGTFATQVIDLIHQYWKV